MKNLFHKRNKTHATLSMLTKDNFVAYESYKAIRTNILHILKNPESNQILITSPYAGAGKTTTSANLSFTFAQLGKKVLVIDADMRKPSLHKMFSISHVPGLSEYLREKVDNLNIVATEYENLYILPAGSTPDNPSELLHSPMFSKLIADISKNYDYIFIDAPPVDVVTDAVIISQYVAGTLLVIRQNFTEKDTLTRTVNVLKNVNANILGYILNAIDYKKFSYRYGHYSSKYGGKYYNNYYYLQNVKDSCISENENENENETSLPQ